MVAQVTDILEYLFINMATLLDDEQDITSDRLTGEYVSVPQFYSGRSVFITGGTGFMGKVS